MNQRQELVSRQAVTFTAAVTLEGGAVVPAGEHVLRHYRLWAFRRGPKQLMDEWSALEYETADGVEETRLSAADLGNLPELAPAGSFA